MKVPKREKAGQKTKSAQMPAEKEGRTYHRRAPRKKGKKRRRQEDVPATAAESVLQESWSVSQFKVPPVEGKTRFHDFELPEPLLHAIYDLGYEYCTPIQAEILPSTLSGKDASGRAQTGTGKTAAFLITVITRMIRNPITGKRSPGMPRILIVAPTRELVLQVAEEARQLSKYTNLKIIPVFGGMDYEKQKRQLAGDPVDIIVATPGRLLDFQRRHDVSLKKVEVLIIDEADRMLDMGFIPDVRKIIYNTPTKERRQTMLFSATLTEEITRLASQWTRQPVTVEIEPEQVAVNTVEQVVYIVTADEKFTLLVNIIDRQDLLRVLVFCNRRDEVRWLSGMLSRYGINCSELTGDVPQKKRVQRLEAFKSGKIRVLVATDVAGRGIHIEGMDHVINFTLPHDPEDYVHRIGRTGRAGASGTSVSFADETDSFYIPAIEAYMGRKLNCTAPDEEWLSMPERLETKKQRHPRPKRKSRRRRRRKTADSLSS